MKKHLLFYAFLASMLCWCVCPQAWANGIEVNGIYYLFSGTTATVTYPGASAPTSASEAYSGGDLVVPSTVSYGGTTYTVTKVGEGAFKYAVLNSLTFSEGLVTVDGSSFNNAKITTSLTFPSTVTTLSGSGDNGAKSTIPTIYIGSPERGSSLTAINGSFMYDAGVTNVYLYGTTPPSSMGAYAFSQNPTFHVLETAALAYANVSWLKDGWSRTRKIQADIEAPYTYSDLTTAISTYEETMNWIGTDPGFYAASSTSALSSALTAAQALTDSETSATYKSAITAMNTAAEQLVVNPLEEGYYYFESAYKPGYVMYNDAATASTIGLKFSSFVADDAKYYWQITKNGSNWNIKNVGTSMYIETSNDWYNTNIHTTYTPDIAQIITLAFPGQYHINNTKYSGTFYALQSTGASGNIFNWGYNSNKDRAAWYLRAVTEQTIDGLYAAQVADMANFMSSYSAYSEAGGPGCFPKDAAIEYNTAYNEAVAIANDPDATNLAKLEKLNAFKEALIVINTKEIIPLTEGYYYIINDNALIAQNGKSEKAMYIDASNMKLMWGELVQESTKFIFKITPNETDWNVQSVENGLYTSGATAFCGTHPASETPEYPVSFTCYPGYGSYYIKANTWTYCPNGNPTGTSNGPGSVWAYNGEGTAAGGAPYKEWTWELRPIPESDLMNLLYLNPAKASLDAAITPANHHDNTGTRSFLLGNEKTSIDGISTSKEAVDALQEAYDALNAAAQEGKTVSECESLITALNNAKAVVDAKSNPLVDGYYYLIGEYGDDTNDTPGGFAIQYGAYASNAMSATKKPFDASETAQMFKVEYDKENGKVYLQNVASGYYLGALKSSRWEFVAEKTALNIVTGENYYWFHNATKAAAARSCSFVLTDTNATGISSTTATGSRLNPVYNVTTGSSAWTISWAFRPVAESLIPQVDVDVDAEDGIATITYAGALTEELYLAALEGIDKTKVRSVDLSTVNVNMVPTQVTNPFENTNTMFYMADDYAHPNEGINLVTQGKCPSLIIVDKEDFVPAKAFEAKNATYRKAGSLDTEGWYSVVLPFDYVVDASLEVLNNAVVKDATIAFSAVEAGETIPAGSPFIYKSKVGGPFSILQINVDCSVAANAAPGTSGALKGTYVKIPKGSATGKLILNAAGSAFATATANASIPAFRAYIDGAVGSGIFTITINDDLTGVVGADADLNAKVDVYSVDGKLVRQGVEAITALQGLESGIYVINGKTIKK